MEEAKNEERGVKKGGAGWKIAVIILCVLLAAAIAFDALLIFWDGEEEVVIEDEDEETIYEDPDVVYLEITGEEDETGVSPCVEYVYPCHWCEDDCEGHDGYLAPSGNFYPFYPTFVEGDEFLQVHSPDFDVSEVDEDGLFWIWGDWNYGAYYTIHTRAYPTFVYRGGLAVGFELEDADYGWRYNRYSSSMEIEGVCSVERVYETSSAVNLFVFETPLGEGEYTLNVFRDAEAKWESDVYSCSFEVRFFA